MTLHPIVERLLEARGIRTPQERRVFLHPNFETDVHDPFLFSRMRDVVERLWQAMERGQSVVIHGDYDADGICGSAILLTALKTVAQRAGFVSFAEHLQTYLPSREGDGYGMSFNAVERFSAQGVELIITVDCGIANTDEIARAYELGMEVIVVDHHQLPQTLSDKALLIHPLVPGETYPFNKLAAVGVAFKVATALYAVAREHSVDIPQGYEKWLLDLVAIATVTDMVPLVGENRVLERYGLRVLSKTRRPGLKALMRFARLEEGERTTTDVGFRLGPRLNAPGRLGAADSALALLLSATDEEADTHAAQLEALNKERQRLTEQSTRHAMCDVNPNDAFIAVVREDIRIGIAGLVAGKIAAQTQRPSVVLTRVGGVFVGSGRAPEGFHFVQAMDACRELMIRGGGHPQAAGMTITPEHVPAWIAAMTREAEGMRSNQPSAEGQNADLDVGLDDASYELVDALCLMAPFGVGNERPLFCARTHTVLAFERVGKTGAHLRLSVTTPGKKVVQCIWFGADQRAHGLTMGQKVDVYYRLDTTWYRGARQIQIEIERVEHV
ncbi:single-stranded-DNA-specific exonuclease RecJ [Candidatus Uhrbacteria bacterium RIFCSPLOWO2_01_FULL_53_9]|uniref:Single-stranded-DNA-specific exonuclease RecJ n=3 Tax=Candidatus Uhriibacteriota TaxID=1752732 RepID=A0A1F7UYX5_9BACT|nr:MAG: single-stranded-DNA-specific exonuclease RecJ [Candidatus Uhrbacteria bacterium RIFCSPHIGHO2_02_FULL_53_13]OGL83459.1 MAG: single-stranded-DNA-specific exonuclease RecJ [Candidatus Uhrbacteria bacterium RIFCSPLOWO2_01_FULL_53_9]